ncbi:Tfp pilus assembly protein FimT/FimU [Patescibacteria group bacterium]
MHGKRTTNRSMLKRPRVDRYRTNRGMSLVIAMVIVPILLAIAVSFVDPIIRSYRAAAADQKTNLAKAVADSMFEEALWQTRDAGTGETTDAEFKKEYDFGKAYGKWWVFGTPETDTAHLISGKYTIPGPGSGDAGGDYCSTREPVVSSKMLEAAQVALGIDVPDHPLAGETDVFEWQCHWNKIREGESVSIPLYVEDGSTVLNPVDLGLTSFTLNIRAACDPAISGNGRTDQYTSELCSYDERQGVYVEDDQGLEDTFAPIVLWEITGTMNEGTAGEDNFYLGPHRIGFFLNSNITTPTINGYYSSPILTENSPTKDQDELDDSIWKYLQNDNTKNNSEFKTVHKPVLTFMVIHTLRDSTGSQIPYLEYQFSAPAPTGGLPTVSSTSKVVRVDVMVDGGYSETLEKSIALPKASTGFVIQQ